ncbi:glycosyltransferase family 4 protein [Mucisphaera calidilacus]|uniref:GDP-mannose-dependent alpha-mannosyltransferase n=1 Tax=Mucisphaera calidilacus TaxID=2527982 RepID=A0A518BWD5_9BACT|nr:glycosyltransferase family 1 protein [Mucisphaera calidilacus]QDU71293.1 GDP-mannose-dependent alpha-mannosyltransferase [Mucisphaera calidilacus]
MRLALVTETYPPEVNGVAMTLQQLAEGMVSRGHEVEVIRPRQGRDDVSRVEGGIEHVTVRGIPLPRYNGLRMGLPSAGVMIRRWRVNPPTVAHVATEGLLGFSALWATHRVNLPVTSAFHTNFHEYFDHYGLSVFRRASVWYLKKFHNACCSTMVPSVPLRDQLASYGFERLSLLGRGVDTDLFHPDRRSNALRSSWGAGPDDLVMVYVGRVAEEKNLPLVIEAYDRVRSEVGDCKLVVVGDGPLLDSLRSDHPEVVFAGTQRGDDLGAHYASGDVFVFGSTTETYGNVIPEAMASGLAVVSFDYAAGQALIREGENGRLAAFDDRDDFIRVLVELCGDRDAVARCRGAARETTLALSWANVHERFEELLMEASEMSWDSGTITRKPTDSRVCGRPSDS